jgi:hypothetical protein
MQDLSAHEKHEFQKLQKDVDQEKCEISELVFTKEKLSARVEEIADLKEQICGSVTQLLLGSQYREVARTIRSLSMDSKFMQ